MIRFASFIDKIAAIINMEPSDYFQNNSEEGASCNKTAG